jgi:hypothetical protein
MNTVSTKKNANSDDVPDYLMPMLAYLEYIHPLSREIRQDISAITRRVDFSRNAVAHSPGGIATHFYFILSGIGRVYFFPMGMKSPITLHLRTNLSAH